MQSRRDYLVSLGLAKPGRGKFSNAAKEVLAKAEAEGMTFSDTAAPSPRPTSIDKPAEPTAPVVPKASDTPYLTVDEYRFPEALYRGVKFVNGRKVEVSLRECCNRCRVSLVNHECNSPVILGDITVRIERR